MSNNTEQKDLIQQWLAVNPGTEDQAQFYLEANNWDLNAALSNFYEEPPLSEGLPPAYHQGDPALPLDPNLVPAGASSHPLAAAPVVSAGSLDVPTTTPQVPSTPSASVPRRRYGSGARIATLSSLSTSDDAGAAGDPQEWYTGGEHSGMAVLPQGQGNAGDGARRGSLVDRILRRATEASDAGPSTQDEPAKKRKPFAGRGRRLGGDNGDNEAHQEAYSDDDDDDDDDYAPSSEDEHEHDDGGAFGDDGEIAIRDMTFWRNGFSIGDGPLHNIEDPVNRQNLEAILQGRAPLEVLNVRPGQRVEMRVTDRRGEDYVPPAAPPVKPFSGTGHRLGGITSSSSSGGVASSSSQQGQQQEQEAQTGPGGKQISLDPSQPTVQVQIRLADGTRLVAKVNPSHTIGDLRDYVISQRPATAARPFSFKVIMPPKVLSDDTATVEQTGIANSAITQHFV
ncbi:protein phosphatase regulator [Coemansia spiralis]|uniref:Protein phosphatase regulator n=2 Tax=Coemansia TaxID=4863 RepID=A0A9W8G3T9_9FUNG|nr:protein phosphatase regulator [Coemansia umbellata]KAJ2620445.1 protein phosphatase regulator [Coemansia sp. RSA 1358]KAJ2673626.1 protein phosphatase regulator [Coemansia spiralis]